MGERVFIAIGSNIGDRERNCLEAIRLVEEDPAPVKVVRVSALYETAPWGGVEQGPFINAVIEVETVLSPAKLLGLLKGIEAKMGRGTPVRWGPRIIDLDILFYGDRVIEEALITIPHPCLHERAFVLVPLSEIAPGFMHPVLKKTVSELAGTIGAAGGVKKINAEKP